MSAVLRFGPGRRGALAALPAEALPVGLLAAAVWVAALAALPAYQVGGAPGIVAGAAFGAAAVSFAASRGLRLRAPVAYLGSVIGLLVLLAVAAGPDPGPVVRALVHGPNRVLTETLPLTGSAVTLSPLVVLTWICSAAATEVVVRTPGSRRGLVALAVPALLYVLCFAVSSGAPYHDRAGGPVVLLLLALAAALRGPAAAGPSPQQASAPMMAGPDDPAPTSPYRAVGAALALAAAVAVVLAVAAPAVPALTGRPASLHRRPPLALPSVTDPVDVMAQLRDGHPQQRPVPELTVRTEGPSSGYLALAEMGDYDGAEWQFSATFEPTGGRVPAPPAGTETVGEATVVQHVDVTGAVPVPLLAALDRPLSVAGTAVVTDAATGMLLPQQGASGRRYTVVSRAPSATLPGLPAADGIDPTLGPPADAAIPPGTSTDLATTLRFLAGLTGERPAPTVAFLQRSAAALRSAEKRIDPAAVASGTGSGPTTTVATPTAVGGTSLSQVINSVNVNRAATPEQFATFFAMVARYLGVPARLVTGFRLAGSSTGSAVPPGTYRVTDRQAWAWVEIPVAGVGWVVVDPTPDATTAAAAPPPESVQAPATTLPPRPASAVPRSQIEGGHALAPKAHFTTPTHHSTPMWVLPVVVVAALILLVALAGPGQAGARRAWRRAARRSSDPSELAVGAWLELLDGLERAGMPADPGATNSEVAADAANQFGPDLLEPASTVAGLADQAVYSTAEPVDADAAFRSWELQRTLRRQLLGQLDRRDRLRFLVSVGRSPRHPAYAGSTSAGPAGR